MIEPRSVNEFTELSKSVNRIAVYQDIDIADISVPTMIEHFQLAYTDTAVLELHLNSSEHTPRTSISFNAISQFTVKNNLIIESLAGEKITHTGDPLLRLREFMSQYHCAGADNTLGAIGFISYDAVRLFEEIPSKHPDNENIPEILLSVYETTLVVDYARQSIRIIINASANDLPDQQYANAIQTINEIILQISSIQKKQFTISEVNAFNTANTDCNDLDFMKRVEQAKEYINAGDAFQIVLSRCFKKEVKATPSQIYASLREINPAPYLFYLSTQFGVFIGASPEKLLEIQHRQIEINPIAGTRPRITTSDETRNRDELLSDPKDQAEHLMLVDLARNDLGSVCKPGTVQVKELLQVKHFSHVTHLTSTVIGQLRDDCDAISALAAAFPAGTLSGAPKIRAMQIIDELEISKRGLYGGAICHLKFNGNLESFIAIRMAMLQGNTATIRAGAGIVYDSNPAAEAEETRHKAQCILDAIQRAENTGGYYDYSN